MFQCAQTMDVPWLKSNEAIDDIAGHRKLIISFSTSSRGL